MGLVSRRSVLAGTAGALALPAIARAQSWPSGTITLVVPLPPGGSIDVIARLIQPGLQGRLGVPVIVENRVGGATTLGAASVAKAPRDGSRWLINADSQGLNPSLMASMPYDPEKDLDPILLIGTAPNVIAAHPSKPFRTFDDVLSFARERGGVNVAVIADTLALVSMVLLSKLGNAKLTPIPYRGGAPAVNDALGGHVDLVAGSVSLLAPQIEKGLLRAIVQTGLQRHPKLPDVPTLAASGFSGFEAISFWGIFGPSGTPAPIVDRFANEVTAILRQDDIATKLTDSFLLDVKLVRGDAFRRFFNDWGQTWGNVIRENGLKSSS